MIIKLGRKLDPTEIIKALNKLGWAGCLVEPKKINFVVHRLDGIQSDELWLSYTCQGFYSKLLKHIGLWDEFMAWHVRPVKMKALTPVPGWYCELSGEAVLEIVAQTVVEIDHDRELFHQAVEGFLREKFIWRRA